MSKSHKNIEKFIIDSTAFHSFIGVIVLLNTIVMGLEQDTGDCNARISVWFVAESIFAAIFVIEILVRIFSQGRQFFRLRLGGIWNFVDLSLVCVSVTDILMQHFIGPCGQSTNLRLLSSLRILRLVRLVRLVRVFRSFRELWLIVSALMSSMETLAWVGVLLVGLLYVAGIFVTSQVGHSDQFSGPSYDGSIWPKDTYFGSVPRSMLTLWQVATLDDWAEGVARHVIFRQPFMALFFILFILMTTFGVFNILVGVIVENTKGLASSEARHHEERLQAEEKRSAIQALRRVFELSDSDKSGTLSRQEFQIACQLPEVQEKFEYLDLDAQEAEELFHLIDTTGSDEITLDDFVDACMQLIGVADPRDIMQISLVMEGLAKKVELVGRRLTEIEAVLSEINDCTIKFTRGPLANLTGIRFN